MREFFKGWRRKVGVVTLVMALVAMAGWGRSHAISDALVLSVSKHKKQTKHGRKLYVQYGTTLYIVKSEMSTLILSRTSFQSPDEAEVEYVGTKYKYPQWETANAIVNPMIANAEWQFCGFGYCIPRSNGEAFEHHVFMAYWSITTPLTAISALLLLSRPRPTTPKKLTEPTSIEGA